MRENGKWSAGRRSLQTDQDKKLREFAGAYACSGAIAGFAYHSQMARLYRTCSNTSRFRNPFTTGVRASNCPGGGGLGMTN